MAFLIFSASPEGSLAAASPPRANLGGAAYRIRDNLDSTTFKRMFLPPACSAIDRAPSGANYGNRHYTVGAHTSNLMIDEMFRVLKQGIQPPPPPSVSAGAGTTPQVGYLRYYDEITKERSPLSEGTIFTGNTTRTWATLPTEVTGEQVIIEGLATIAAGVVTGNGNCNFAELRPGDRIANAAATTRWAQIRTVTTNNSMTIDDTGMAAGPGAALIVRPVSRVSHLELWLAVNGALPRLVFRVRLGTTSVVESVATLALGEAETISFGAMPLGSISVFYNDRQFVAGVEGHRDTVYASAIAFPERHEGLRFVTPYNEPIVGMFRFRDYIVILCPDSSYKLQGYTSDDYVRTVLEPKIGGLGHVTNAVSETFALVPGRKGVQVFNGGFNQGIPTRLSEWSDAYDASPLQYEAGISVVNPGQGTFQFYPRTTPIGGLSGATSAWIGAYTDVSSLAGGSISPLEWTDDSILLPDGGRITTAAYLVPSGTKIGKLYLASSLGKIYEEDTRDSTPWFGTSVAATGHHYFGDPGGSRGEGKELVTAWSYVMSEISDWQFQVWPGDERAYPHPLLSAFYSLHAGGGIPGTPTFKEDVPASVATTLVGAVVSQALCTHTHQVKKSGRGFTFAFVLTEPQFVCISGVGGVVGVGEISRPGCYNAVG